MSARKRSGPPSRCRKRFWNLRVVVRLRGLAHPLAVGQLSPLALNSKTGFAVVVDSGSDRALPICCV